MQRRSGLVISLWCTLLVGQGTLAHAQWGFPGGFGDWGWGGWGGAATAAGDHARGMGVFAQGAGFYHKQTAVADSINAETVIRWNNYMYESGKLANQARLRRMEQRRVGNIERIAANQQRLRDNPEPRDINQGDALNVAMEEINDPRVYARALKAARVKVGGDNIRIIPFQYNAAAITVGLHQLATGTLPAPLLRPDFAAEIEAIKVLDRQIVQQIEQDKNPDPATVQKLLGAIYAAEDKTARILRANSIELKQADRFLKALHGLVVMLKMPDFDRALSGVDQRPNATLGDLLSFMSAFNLRFGVATTPRQREVYRTLYRQLVDLRNEVSPNTGVVATIMSIPGSVSSWIQSFFSGMSYDDLRKIAPRPM
jgi:hypothetical protein